LVDSKPRPKLSLIDSTYPTLGRVRVRWCCSSNFLLCCFMGLWRI